MLSLTSVSASYSNYNDDYVTGDYYRPQSLYNDEVSKYFDTPGLVAFRSDYGNKRYYSNDGQRFSGPLYRRYDFRQGYDYNRDDSYYAERYYNQRVRPYRYDRDRYYDRAYESGPGYSYRLGYDRYDYSHYDGYRFRSYGGETYRRSSATRSYY